MRLIGINGFKESGKDTTYNIIARDFTGYGPAHRVERRAFADKLKIMAALALGFERTEDELISLMDSMKHRSTISVLYDEPGLIGVGGEVLHDLTGREYLQWFGGHARTVFGEGFWVDQVVPEQRTTFNEIWSTLGRNMAGAREVGMPAIGCITDVRYPNEAERVLDVGGEVWEVIRPGLESDGHASETPLPRELITTQIDNSGDFAHLARQVSSAMVNGACAR